MSGDRNAPVYEPYGAGQDAFYALWHDSSPYRSCPREQVMSHGAAVTKVSTSQWRDFFNGSINYACLIEFADGCHAELFTPHLDLRDEFAAELRRKQ